MMLPNDIDFFGIVMAIVGLGMALFGGGGLAEYQKYQGEVKWHWPGWCRFAAHLGVAFAGLALLFLGMQTCSRYR